MQNSLLAAFLLALLPCEALDALPRIRLRRRATGERHFVDEFGRERFFHGSNAVVKGPPWIPSRDGFDPRTSLTAKDFELMRAAGLNLLRLGVMWPGVEPQRSSYNESYLAIIKDIAQEAATYGIYILADMHQDLWVINGFYMGMRSKFTAPGSSIYYYEVEWPAEKMSWADFRGKLLGPTDPASAPEGSLRQMIYSKWSELGLLAQPDTGDNGVHGSASPFEALAERCNWLQASIETDAFGKALVASGIPLPTLTDEWFNDPQVDFEGGKKSLFDLLEDLDAAACLKKCKEIAVTTITTKTTEETIQAGGKTHTAFVFVKPHAVHEKVCQTFAGTPELLGINIINEPFAGNVYEDPSLLLPHVADRKRLQPAYDVVAGHIRAVAPDALIFFAGTTWDRTGRITDRLPLGFEHAPGGTEFANRSVNSFHYYTPPQSAEHVQGYFQQRLQDAQRLGTGLFLTETCCDNFFQDAAPVADKMGVSWLHWQWKTFCRETNESLKSPTQAAEFGACKTGFGGWPFDDGVFIESMYRALARPFAHAIAGNFSFSSFGAESGHFRLEFLVDPSIQEPTIISTPAVIYPRGFNLAVSPAGACDIQYLDGVVELRNTGKLPFGQKLVVQVSPKGAAVIV